MTKEEHRDFERKRKWLKKYGAYEMVKEFAEKNGYKLKYLLEKMPASIFVISFDTTARQILSDNVSEFLSALNK